MYKGFSRFLNRIKTEIGNFSRFLVRPERIPSENKRGQASATSHRRTGNKRDSQHTRCKLFLVPPIRIEEEHPPAISFEKHHRLALRIGESNHMAHAFVRENAEAIMALSNVRQMSCMDIARRLNEIGTQQPRSGEWTSNLVYHFTRHYMSIRPPYFTDDVSSNKQKS